MGCPAATQSAGTGWACSTSTAPRAGAGWPTSRAVCACRSACRPVMRRYIVAVNAVRATRAPATVGPTAGDGGAARGAVGGAEPRRAQAPIR